MRRISSPFTDHGVTMHWTLSCRHTSLTLLVIIAVNNWLLRMMAAADCPPVYWDGPSKLCADFILNALNGVSHSNSPRTLNITCRSWENSNSCYQQLRRECISDVNAISTLKAHIRRYVVYSLPCHDQNPIYRILLDCFLAYLTPTQTCAEAFDKSFRQFVVDKQYGHACRVVVSSLNCFHSLMSKIEERCGQEGADEYYNSYIQPLVDQSRDIVGTWCKLSPPLDKDFVVSSTNKLLDTNRQLQLFLVCCASLCVYIFVSIAAYNPAIGGEFAWLYFLFVCR